MYSKVPVGTRVDLLESRGPKQSAYVMPDLISMRQSDAQEILRQASIATQIQSRTVSSAGLSGKVVKQNPNPGSKLSGGKVVLWIGTL